jgi:hypothetical protein
MTTPRCKVEITRHALFARVVITREGYPPLLTTMDRDVKASSRKIAKLKSQLMHRAMNPDEPDDPADDIESSQEEHDEANNCPHAWSSGCGDGSEFDEERTYCLLCGQDGDA